MPKILNKKINIRAKLAAGKQSPYQTYKSLVVGDVSFTRFLLYELITVLTGLIPGALGYFLRKQFYPLIMKQVGKGVIIGRNVVLRHSYQIILEDNVTIDDNCVIDARGGGDDGIIIKNNVLINRNCMLLAKNGAINIGDHSSLGSNTVIVSMDGVQIGNSVLMAGGCYLSAGAYRFDDLDKPVMDQEAYTKGPIRIGSGAWIGTRVTILDGISIGKNAVVGASALVITDVPDYTVAVGIPAKKIKSISSHEI